MEGFKGALNETHQMGFLLDPDIDIEDYFD